jgi:hypothetical protein
MTDATDHERIEHGFRLALSRTPASDEVQYLVGVLAAERRRLEADPQAAEELVPLGQRAASASAIELAAWFHVANVLLNLDETITKN